MNHNKAYKMKKKLYDSDNGTLHHDILISIDGIGLTYMKLSEYDKALKYQRKALKEWEKLKGSKKTQNYAISLNNISQTYKKKGEYEKAFYLMRVTPS